MAIPNSRTTLPVADQANTLKHPHGLRERVLAEYIYAYEANMISAGNIYSEDGFLIFLQVLEEC